MSEKFNGAVTAMGTSLIAKAIANNTKMSFLKIVGSKSTYTDKQLPTLTDDVLSSASHDQEGHISNVTIADETTIKTELVLDGSSVEADYQLNTVLILATVDGTDHLFGVLKANQPQYMNAYDGKSSTNLEINCSFKVANTDAVSITVDTRGTLTVDDYNRLHEYTDTQVASASGVANKRMDNAVAAEAKDRAAAVTSESTARSSAVAAEATARSNAVSGEASARAAADTKLQNSASTAASDIAVLRTSAASYTDTKVQSAATVASNATSTEAVNRASAVAAESTARSNAVSDEAAKRIAADSTETKARSAADATLQSSASANSSAAAKAQTTANNASSAVVNEATARSAADVKLQGSATANSAAAAKAQSAVDSFVQNIIVSGRNLLPNSTFEDLTGWSTSGNQTASADSNERIAGLSSIHLKATGGGNGANGVLSTRIFGSFSTGDKVTVTFFAKTSSSAAGPIGLHTELNGSVGAKEVTLSSDWKLYTVTLTYSTSPTFYFWITGAGDAWIALPMLVQGSIPAQHQPAPESKADDSKTIHTAVKLTKGIDLDDVTRTGTYSILSDTTILNAPPGFNGWGNLFVVNASSGLPSNGCFQLLSVTNMRQLWYRVDSGSGWSDWKNMTLTDDELGDLVSHKMVSIELNATSRGPAFIDFHNSALNNDYDARIILEGSPTNGSDGSGVLTIEAKSLVLGGEVMATQPWVNGAFAAKTYSDTRNDNQNPKWYLTNHGGKGNYYEFKVLNAIGITAAILPSGITNTYGACFTTVGPADGGAGYPDQLVKVFGKAGGFPVYLHRTGVSDTAWSKWYLEPIIERG
jgi:hypothetical protein